MSPNLELAKETFNESQGCSSQHHKAMALRVAGHIGSMIHVDSPGLGSVEQTPNVIADSTPHGQGSISLDPSFYSFIAIPSLFRSQDDMIMNRNLRVRRRNLKISVRGRLKPIKSAEPGIDTVVPLA